MESWCCIGEGDFDYYISPLWSDDEVRQFRRNVRRHNICIRHDMKRFKLYFFFVQVLYYPILPNKLRFL